MRALRFLIALVAALGLLTWAASVIVTRTTAAWFEKDIRLRADLAVAGARRTLAEQWTPEQRRRLNETLAAIARDERIMAVAACNADDTLLAATPAYPKQLACGQLEKLLGVTPGGVSDERPRFRLATGEPLAP